MLTNFLRARVAGLLNAVARFFLALGFTPNALTLLGLLLVAAIAVVIGAGYETMGGILLIFALGFDAVD